MSVFKCKMCGGAIEFEQGASVGVCDSCGTKQTLPRLDDDRRANLYDRANHFRRNNEFDKAMGIYEQILNEDGADAEAYWSLVLCRYGVEYVEDPATHKRIPTVNRAQFTSIYMDEDYKSALRYADGYQKGIYEEEAKAIDDVQKGILEISSKEEPFDVFICYKETDANGRRTPDSVLANDLYHQLTNEGFKVFFARITLEDKLGTAYEPYIFAALNSSKVMVVIGTKPEYFNAVWVKNEWSRYLALVKNSGGKKILIPAYKDMDPYDLPEEFSHLQAQDMGKLGFMQDLIRGIRKIAKANEPRAAVKETVVLGGNTNVDLLLKRAFMFLEDESWNEADAYCERALDQNPESAQAYLGKLMAELRVRRQEDLQNCEWPFNDNPSYRKAVRFGGDEMSSVLAGYIDHINERNENARLTDIYNDAVDAMNMASDEEEYKSAADEFKTIPGFKDADSLAVQCLDKAEVCREEENERRRKEEEGRKRKEREEEERRIATAKKRKRVISIAAPAIAACIVFAVVIATVIIPNAKYDSAMELYNAGEYDEAIAAFKTLDGYEDSEMQVANCYIAKSKDAEIGDTYVFGEYEQDNDTSNGKEPIEWIVLDKDESSLFLISKYGLDCRVYASHSGSDVWKSCSLRNWLNESFLNDAFTESERAIIGGMNVSADESPESNTDLGDVAVDKVSLLSASEAYGYFSSAQARKCVPTTYAKAQGAQTDSPSLTSSGEASCRWWLRSPDVDNRYAAYVDYSGSVHRDGCDVNGNDGSLRPRGLSVDCDGVCVRPALRINLNSSN